MKPDADAAVTLTTLCTNLQILLERWRGELRLLEAGEDDGWRLLSPVEDERRRILKAHTAGVSRLLLLV